MEINYNLQLSDGATIEFTLNPDITIDKQLQKDFVKATKKTARGLALSEGEQAALEHAPTLFRPVICVKNGGESVEFAVGDAEIRSLGLFFESVLAQMQNKYLSVQNGDYSRVVQTSLTKSEVSQIDQEIENEMPADVPPADGIVTGSKK